VKVAKEKSKHKASRREFVKKAAYIAPAIITLQAAPSYARAGSVKPPTVRPVPVPPIRTL
jgi:hypothetical protein